MSMAHGAKTVVATAAEIFAGSSRLASRNYMRVRNMSDCLRVRLGDSTVSQDSGRVLEPGEVAEFDFVSGADVAIYAISEGAAVRVEVFES